MAAGPCAGESLGVDRLLSYAEDLVGVLRVSTDRDGNAQVGAGARRLLSACRSESHDLQLQLKEYQEKIDLCKEKIDKAKVETIADDELNALQNNMEEKLQEEKQLRGELRVLHYPERCLLCDQEQETINHLLIACPFAREFWYSILRHVGLQQFAPQPSDTEFDEWWDSSWRTIPEHQKKGFNSLVALGAWIIWTHRNACVFEGATPSMSRALSATSDEQRLWEMAGARSLSSLTSPVHEE